MAFMILIRSRRRGSRARRSVFPSVEGWFSRKSFSYTARSQFSRRPGTPLFSRRLGTVAFSFPEVPIDAPRRQKPETRRSRCQTARRGAQSARSDGRHGRVRLRSDDDGVDAASHLEASPAGPGGAATVKAELERPATFGCAFGRKRRGVPERTPASPASVEGAARRPPWPRPRLGPPHPEAPLRSPRAPIPRTASGGAAGATPAAAAGAASDTPRATPTPTRAGRVRFRRPRDRTYVSGTDERTRRSRRRGRRVRRRAPGAVFLARPSLGRERGGHGGVAHVHRAHGGGAGTPARETRSRARSRARSARSGGSGVGGRVRETLPATTLASRDEGTAASGELEHDSSSKSESAESAFSSRNTGTSPSPPKVISTLTRLAAEATARADADWARTDEVRAMLAEDVVYRTIEVRACAAETP